MGYYLGKSQEVVNLASSLHWAAYFVLQHRFMEVIKTQCQFLYLSIGLVFCCFGQFNSLLNMIYFSQAFEVNASSSGGKRSVNVSLLACFSQMSLYRVFQKLKILALFNKGRIFMQCNTTHWS